MFLTAYAMKLHKFLVVQVLPESPSFDELPCKLSLNWIVRESRIIIQKSLMLSFDSWRVAEAAEDNYAIGQMH